MKYHIVLYMLYNNVYVSLSVVVMSWDICFIWYSVMSECEIVITCHNLSLLVILHHISTGNLMMFSQSMERHQVRYIYLTATCIYLCIIYVYIYLSIQAFFIKAGIYLILEKLKTVAMRNLFKRVYVIITKLHY